MFIGVRQSLGDICSGLELDIMRSVSGDILKIYWLLETPCDCEY